MVARENTLASSVTTQPSAGRISKVSFYKLTERITPWLLIAPLLILIVTFIYWPLVYQMWLSFYDWNFVRPDMNWVGLRNYERLTQDPRFLRSLNGTWIYFVTLVPLQVFLPLGIALLLWPIRKAKTQSAYRIMLFSPTVIAYSVGAVMWMWIFNPHYGVLNKILIGIGIDKINWLGDRDYAIWSIIIVATWKTLGFHLLLYLAALEAVPGDVIEAAQLDGASNWEVMRTIRFPLITPTFFFVLVTTVISVNDDVFGAINVLTDGGPFESTTNVIYYLYQQGFEYFQIGTAAALSVVIFAVTVFLTWIQFRFGERFVHYG